MKRKSVRIAGLLGWNCLWLHIGCLPRETYFSHDEANQFKVKRLA